MSSISNSKDLNAEGTVLTPKFRKSLQNPPESPWFDWIACGKKRYEGRLWKDDWASIAEGDLIVFICPEKRELMCRVTSLSRFESFGAAFDALGSELVPIPGVNTTEVNRIYGQYYKDEDVKNFGVVAVQVEPLYLL